MYACGISGIVIWLQHIITGLLLIYIGYTGITIGKISTNMSLILVVTGVFAMLYHSLHAFDLLAIHCGGAVHPRPCDEAAAAATGPGKNSIVDYAVIDLIVV